MPMHFAPSPVFLQSFTSPPEADPYHSSENPGAFDFKVIKCLLHIKL